MRQDPIAAMPETDYDDGIHVKFNKDLNLTEQFLSKSNKIAKKVVGSELGLLMYKHFWKIREEHGLGDSPLHSSDEDEEINNAAFHELRPNNKQKLKDFLMQKLDRENRSEGRIKTPSDNKRGRL